MTSMPPRDPQDLLCLTDEDNNALRLIVVVPWALPGTWQDWSQRFEPGPVVVSSCVGVPVTYSASRRLLRAPAPPEAWRSPWDSSPSSACP
ncbi:MULTISPECIES: hypothetical protein [Actinomyces]|uniref:Uncharacterized protein n=1 Tax=Actinomyces respiraculi TaxID=2744574 RepID=A0A7T0LJV8_9ACTO|nr:MULTISPECIES: hypothetical protein [Actinomyces]QPL05116.1 hypothetical protein ID810_10335 [Actinomyces respiraculi]